MLSRATRRRFWFGLQTIFGFPARGFFIPYRYAANVPDTQPVYKELEAVFKAKENLFRDFCLSLDAYSDDFSGFKSAPGWQQAWFPRIDGAAAYGLVRQYKPKTIIEVGSGHSTRFMAQAVNDEGLNCTQIAIDPFPRASIKTLPINWQAELLNETHLQMFADLDAGDIAFFDSSHILMPGTDVDMILNRILPVLKKGVLIHIHDVLLPDPYPKQWLWRGYNEQNVLGPLIANGSYDLVFASAYVATRMKETILQTKLVGIPLFEGAIETSLWLKKQ